MQGAGISETAFYRWLQCGAMAKSGKFRKFYQSLKESPIGSNQPRLRRRDLDVWVVVTAKSGRFLEFFLETLKRPGRMSRTSPSSNGPRPERVPTGMRRHADAGAPSDRSDLKPPWLTASGQTAILLHFRGGEGDSKLLDCPPPMSPGGLSGLPPISCEPFKNDTRYSVLLR